MHHHDDDAHLAPVDDAMIFALTRPDNNLLPLFIIYAIASAVAFPVTMPYLYFRFRTLRYRFDNEGLAVSYGLLWRRESYLTYARIQDIHVTSGFVQRWLGLADLHIQTASGSATAEMTIEGLLEFEEMRDYLYTRMRGFKDPAAKRIASPEPAGQGAIAAASDPELLALLRGITEELRGARAAIEQVAARSGRDHV